ncbi:Alpha/Beta hydrolase protein [Mycena crocata]|nr:Alpha/Beta hydrolase protein [Mycena crocata]
MASGASRYLPYLSLLVPPLLAATYLFASPPILSSRPPGRVTPGLASLPLDSRARIVYPEDWIEGGGYANLPTGRIRYWVVGPESGPKLTLIHGISTPALALGRLVPILAAAGYRVLVYDLPGRGYSDSPPADVPYDTKLYVTQLALLLQHLRWERTGLVGYSMGGAIAAAFLATFPDLVERDVVLIASVGMWDAPWWLLTRFRHLPFVQKFVFRKFAGPLKPSPTETPMQEIIRLQAAHLPGYPRALVSSLHHGPVTSSRWAFEQPEVWGGRRVLFVHGTADAVVPPASSPLLQTFIERAQGSVKSSVDVTSSTLDEVHDEGNDTKKRWGNAQIQQISIDGAGHDVVWARAEEVGRAVVGFLRAGDV